MFSVPRPSFVQSNPKIAVYGDVIDNKFSNETLKARKEIVESALKALPPTNQSPGGQIGFFEQGIITGLGLFVLPAVGTVVGLSAWGVLEGIKYLRAR